MSYSSAILGHHAANFGVSRLLALSYNDTGEGYPDQREPCIVLSSLLGSKNGF